MFAIRIRSGDTAILAAVEKAITQALADDEALRDLAPVKRSVAHRSQPRPFTDINIRYQEPTL